MSDNVGLRKEHKEMSCEHPKQGKPTESSVTYKGGADGKAKSAGELREEEQPRKKENEEREPPPSCKA